MIANKNCIRIFFKGKVLYFFLERKFNIFKRTVSFHFIPVGDTYKNEIGCSGPLKLVYDNVEHVFKPKCEQLKSNGELRFSLEKYIRECDFAA